MGNKRDSGTAMFLMEMIAVVCFFILCAGVCILVFVRANNLSRLSQDTNRAALAAESVAEVWKAEAEGGLATRFGMSGPENGKAADAGSSGVRDGKAAGAGSSGAGDGKAAGVILWDKDWKQAAEDGTAEFCGYVEIETAANVETASIRIVRKDDDTELFSLTAKRIAGDSDRKEGAQ